MSRHYYDLYVMGQAGIFDKAIQQDTLMKALLISTGSSSDTRG